MKGGKDGGREIEKSRYKPTRPYFKVLVVGRERG